MRGEVVLVVSQRRQSPLGVPQSNPYRLAWRGLVFPLAVGDLGCLVSYDIKIKKKEKSGYDREFE